jgi:hypothetical protein
MESQLWTEGASPWPHEREALAFVRARFPSYEPYRAWTNVEFIAEDGSVNEVDLLAVTPRGFLLVEIKSWPGVLFGDGQRWRRRQPNGAEVSFDHPLLLTKHEGEAAPVAACPPAGVQGRAATVGNSPGVPVLAGARLPLAGHRPHRRVWP